MTRRVTLADPAIMISVAILVGALIQVVLALIVPLEIPETITQLIAAGSVTHLLNTVSLSGQPPLFYLLTSISLAVGGASLLALRLVSVMAGVGLVSLAPSVARRFRWNPVLVTWLVAVGLPWFPFLLAANPYSLFLFLTFASVLALGEALNEPANWRRWLLWSLLTAFLLSTLHLGLVVVVLEGLVTLLLRRPALTQSWHWLGALLLLAAAYLPLLPLIQTEWPLQLFAIAK